MLAVVSALVAAPINKSDWDLAGKGAEYSNGEILFKNAGDFPSQAVYKSVSASYLLDRGFASTVSIPTAMASTGSRITAAYTNSDSASITTTAITWGVSFSDGGSCDFEIFDNNGHSIKDTLNIDVPSGVEMFDITFKLENLGGSGFAAVIESAALNFLLKLDSAVLASADSEGFALTMSPSDFDLSKNNAKMTDFSAPPSSSSVPEPATYAVLIGLAAMGFALYRRHR